MKFFPAKPALTLIFLFAAGALYATEESGENWFKTVFSSGEYSVDETYIGESGVKTGHRMIDDFDEHDTILSLVFTPRVKIGVLRFGAEWEHFTFGFPSNTPLPNT